MEVKKLYTIGRSSDNSIVLNFDDVSEHHAQILVVEKEVFLEDLNSTNGTFVNGSRIKKIALIPSDTVLLATQPLNIKPVFEALLSDPEFNDYTKEFDALKSVYEDYEAEREKIVSDCDKKLGIWKFFIITIPIIIVAFYCYCILKEEDSHQPIYLAFNLAFTAFAFLLTNDKEKNKKLKQAKIEFNRKYKCPRCKTYQLSKEWELHRDEKHCPNCKAIWAKEYIPEF